MAMGFIKFRIAFSIIIAKWDSYDNLKSNLKWFINWRKVRIV